TAKSRVFSPQSRGARYYLSQWCRAKRGTNQKINLPWPSAPRRRGDEACHSVAFGERHADRAVAGVDVDDLAGDTGTQVGGKEGSSVADILDRHITTQRRNRRHVTQHLSEATNTGGRESLDGAGGDAVDANALGPEIGGEEANAGLQAGLGQTHYVVARQRA